MGSTNAARHPKELLIPNLKLRLREQLREVMRFHHYSPRTEDAYWDWMRRFILFHAKRHPREMAEPEVVAFLSHLAEHPFGSLQRWFGYDHFLLQGLARVRTEWSLMTLAYNLKRALNLVSFPQLMAAVL